jgi:hypothetical protein
VQKAAEIGLEIGGSINLVSYKKEKRRMYYTFLFLESKIPDVRTHFLNTIIAS